MSSYADPDNRFPIMGHIPSNGRWTPDSPLTRLFYGCRPDSSKNILRLHERTTRSSVIDRSLSILASADDYPMSREVPHEISVAGPPQ